MKFDLDILNLIDFEAPYVPIGHIDTPIVEHLIEFLESIDDTSSIRPSSWHLFYRYCIVAYKSTQQNRHRISELSEIFRRFGINNPGELAVLYAHILYTLALYEHKEIYGRDFNP